MESKTSKTGGIQTALAVIVIPTAIIISILVFMFILGNPANFIDNNPENNPLPGNYLGIIYKGGVIVPILISLLLIVITFSIERLISIGKSRGKGNTDAFVRNIREAMNRNDIDGARAICRKQEGSLANVVDAGLNMYKSMEADKNLDKERKILAIQKELEEATTLELPMLSKNLMIISTIASIATLLGLLGTV